MSFPSAGQDMPLDARRRRLKFRCWHRGIKEMDLIMGHFADRHVDAMSEEELGELEQLLEEPDTTLYYWISGRQEVPADKGSDLLRKIMALDFMPQSQ